MFPSAEYVAAGELTARREQIANDFARVGRVRRPARRRHRATQLAGVVNAAAHRVRIVSPAAR